MANKKRNRNSAARAAGRRSQAEAERTRTRILDRAEILFARRGYRGVSVRELSRACGVRPFTIQHHFGSKPGLYQAVLSRWDDEILARVGAVVAGQSDLATIVEKVVDELFDFFLEKRSWVTLTVRAALGEGLAKGVSLQEQSWVQFIDRSMADQKLGAMKHDLGLLLITVEGILHHHILSTAHYRKLFGKDLSDPRIRERTKQHLQSVILALVEAGR
ncbi:MAG TPA: TetR/AcrR family transcriptional regulator [Myxococcota bacterium]|nr:TetR/AcrR family transcriptional regulator [Myxococcota bacterium]